MPRYFFDCFDGDRFHADPHGIDLADHDEAAVHGASLAQALMGENTDSVGVRAVATTVRSMDGTQVYAAHLTFHGLKLPTCSESRSRSG